MVRSPAVSGCTPFGQCFLPEERSNIASVSILPAISFPFQIGIVLIVPSLNPTVDRKPSETFFLPFCNFCHFRDANSIEAASILHFSIFFGDVFIPFL
jgi:hypothetical protein